MIGIGPDSAIWMDGRVLDAGQGYVSLFDRGFTLGDGLFETMLWTGQDIRFFTDHMARLADAAVALQIPMPQTKNEIYAGLMELAEPAKGQKAALRLTLSRGIGPRGLGISSTSVPRLMATMAVFEPPTSPVHLKTVSIVRNSGAPSTRFKTLSYIDNVMALQQGRALGGDDALMLGTSGFVACTSSANIVFRYRGASLTPALEDGALPGIVRQRLIQAGMVEEARISPLQLANCEEAAVTNALIGVRAVSQIDDHQFGMEHNWSQTLNHVVNV